MVVLMSSMVIWSLMVMLRMNKKLPLVPEAADIVHHLAHGNGLFDVDIFSHIFTDIVVRPSFPSFQRRRMERTVNSLEMEATCRMLSFLIFSWFSRFP